METPLAILDPDTHSCSSFVLKSNWFVVLEYADLTHAVLIAMYGYERLQWPLRKPGGKNDAYNQYFRDGSG